MNVLRPLLFILGCALLCWPAMAADDFELPPGVTPALRAACEKDVRRLCIGENPTVAKVKACVAQRFGELGTRCKVALAAAGFSRDSTPDNPKAATTPAGRPDKAARAVAAPAPAPADTKRASGFPADHAP